MRYLLDTQILIWALEDHVKLKISLRNIIENPNNTILVSQISLMEIAIKLKLGKLRAFIVEIEEVTAQLLSDGFQILPLASQHIFAYQTIPFYEDHRDPFDRFLLATA